MVILLLSTLVENSQEVHEKSHPLVRIGACSSQGRSCASTYSKPSFTETRRHPAARPGRATEKDAQNTMIQPYSIPKVIDNSVQDTITGEDFQR